MAQNRVPSRLIAGVRAINRHPRLVGAAKLVREQALGDDELIDRLSSTRGRGVDLAARGLAAARSDAPGMLGEIGLTALQAWQRLAEAQGRGRGEVEVAVLFTDLVGFSSWALQAGDDLAVSLLREVIEAIEPPIIERRGEVVKRLGDGVMAAFWDARSAIEAAFDVRERVATVEVGGHTPRLRTGIHLGRPRKIGGDYLGVDVNIAARLTEAAQPGEILVSGRALAALESGSVIATEQPFTAEGIPTGLTAHALQPA